MTTVMVSGKWDPPHEGHIDSIVKASTLGDYLIVIVQPDEGVKAVKGTCYIPLWARLVLVTGILRVYDIAGAAFEGKDLDGKSVKSILHFKPNFYAKGGDRKKGNIPEEEVQACKEAGCKIVYGVGDLLNSSSKIVK